MSKRQKIGWRRCRTTWRKSTHVIAPPLPPVLRTCYRTLRLVSPAFYHRHSVQRFITCWFLHLVISVRMRRSSWMSLKRTWLASTGEPRASFSLNLAIPPLLSKASCQSRQCVTSNRWRWAPAPRLIYNISLYCLLRLIFFLVLNRSQCTKEKSVRFLTTHSLISGRSWTSQAMRPLYLLSALLCHRWTKRL